MIPRKKSSSDNPAPKLNKKTYTRRLEKRKALVTSLNQSRYLTIKAANAVLITDDVLPNNVNTNILVSCAIVRKGFHGIKSTMNPRMTIGVAI